MSNKLYQLVGESQNGKTAVDLVTTVLPSAGAADFAENFIKELKHSDIGGAKDDITNVISVGNDRSHSSLTFISRQKERPKIEGNPPIVFDGDSLRESIKTFPTIDSLSAVLDEARTVDEIPALVKPTSYLTTKPSKVRIILEDTKFQPSPTVMMSGKNFAEAYKQQLTKIIYGEQSEKNAEVLISFTSVFNLVYKGKDPVQLRSTKFSRKLNDIIKTLNDFFRVHNHVLTSIVGMVHSEVENNTFSEPRKPARDSSKENKSKTEWKPAEKWDPEKAKEVFNNPPQDDIFEH